MVIMSLIVIGGIGFIVWSDLLEHTYHFKKYRLHTKIVLITTLILIFGGALLFYILKKILSWQDDRSMSRSYVVYSVR